MIAITVYGVAGDYFCILLNPKIKTMEEVKIRTRKPILVKIADQLLKDQQELDLLAAQISAGKAEVKDKFEEAKEQMKKSVEEFRETLSSERKQTMEWANAVRNKLNELEEQLTKGKAESKLMFEKQRKNILAGIETIKNELRKNTGAPKSSNYFIAAAEKIKLQMELFEKKIGAQKSELTKGFKDEMNNAREKINSLIAGIKEKKDDVDVKLGHVNDEIQLSYKHLKKAIRAL